MLAIAAVLAIALAPGVARLRIDVDGRALLPRDAPEVAADGEVRARFGVRDVIAVVLERSGPNGVFEADPLAAVTRITAAIEELDGLDAGDVLSLANEKSDHVRVGALEFRAWLDPPPASREELDTLRRELESAGIWRGTLLAMDSPASATAILVRVPESVERGEWIGQLERTVAAAAGAHPEFALHVVGAPAAEALLGEHILSDLRVLLPIALVALSLVFALVFRCAPAVVLPAVEVGFVLACTFGAMGWSASPVYLTSAVIPVILASVVITDEIHLLAELRRRLVSRAELDAPAAVRATLERLAPAIAATAMTTAVGFGAFAFSPLPPVRDFGVFMLLGVSLSAFWSLCVGPVLLARTSAASWTRGAGSSDAARRTRVTRWFATIAEWSVRRRAFVLGAFALAAVAAVAGALRVRVDDSWITSFSPASPLRRSSEVVDRLFGGVHLLDVAVVSSTPSLSGSAPASAFAGREFELEATNVPDSLDGLRGARLVVRTRARGDPLGIDVFATIDSATRSERGVRFVLEPGATELSRRVPSSAAALPWRVDAVGRLLRAEALEELARFERFAASLGEFGVGRAVGPHEHLATMNYMLRGRDEAQRRVPATAEEQMLLLDHYRRVRGQRELLRVLAPEADAGLVTIFLRGSTYERTEHVLAALRNYERTHLAPIGFHLGLSGDIALSQTLVGGIVEGQTSSLGSGLVGVLLAVALVLRSPLRAFVCVIPAAFAIAANFAFLGAADIPLGVATSMFAAITLGVGVDYAIHFVERTDDEPDAPAADRARHALELTGPAIAIDVLAVSVSFGLLALSTTPANARLGALMLVGLVTAFVTTVLLLPALYSFRSRPR